MKMIHIPIPGHPEATLEGYILDCEITLGHEIDRPAIVVCPGGGYAYCCPREAEPVALRYAAAGFHAFILRYSVGWDAADFAPLKEVSWVIGHLRENAENWHINPEKIAVCGFSAGGHLALASGLLGENKPNAMILGYPAVNIPNYSGVNFMLQLLTGRKEVTDADSAYFSLENHITKQSPPVFMAATAEDMLTGFGALPVAKKYSDLGMPYELHVFQHGPHGYSMADETSADGSEEMLNPAFAQWHGLSVAWLHRIFGAPVHGQKNTKRMVQILKEMGIELPDMSGTNFG
jgi:acetyl esterase/lipase